MDDEIKTINLTPQTITAYGVCGYKDVEKHIELRNKIAWFSYYYEKGLRIKALVSKTGGYQGMLEYIPGEFAHRPVNAVGYMFIHCIFTGFKKEFKGKGYATIMLQQCINEAKEQNMLGVAVVTRKGSFMANNEIFIKNEFEIIETSKPDFELLVLKFDKKSQNPSFKSDVLSDLNDYKSGFTIFRSPQCPYTEKNVKSIINSATTQYQLKTTLIDITNSDIAQKTPSPFGTFCIVYNGEVISHHPISNTRFENIMNQLLVKKVKKSFHD